MRRILLVLCAKLWYTCILHCSSGIGAPIDAQEKLSLSELRTERERKNKELAHSLREDSHWSRELLEITKEDQAMGRMASLRLIHELNLAKVTLSPRFAIVQGICI